MLRYKYIYQISLIIFLAISTKTYSQKETVWFDGAARSFFTRDFLDKDINLVETTPRNISNGYNLLDLNTHINPIDDFEIFSQLRIRNTFGDFFGSGTTIDVRQLTASGVINKKVKFSIGDIFLNQSRFTLHNSQNEMEYFFSEDFSSYRDIICYENFYFDDRWRMQGIQFDFSYNFDRFLKSLEYDFFITRPRGSSAISESLYLSDLLMAGGSMILDLNHGLKMSTSYINTFEVPSTGTTNISIRNPVYHSSISHDFGFSESLFTQVLEFGFSTRHWLESSAFEDINNEINSSEGMFLDYCGTYLDKDSTLELSLGYRYVDPNFRSSGAQTRRLNFNSDVSVYPEYNNLSSSREISLFDIMTDENIYNQEMTTTLSGFNPAYSNVLPYGDATPNRSGVFASGRYVSPTKNIVSNINAGIYSEVIGQGTENLRSFSNFNADLKFNFHQIFSGIKKTTFTVSYYEEKTTREGNDIETINLRSNQISANLNVGISNNFIGQLGFKNLSAVGNEILNNRDEFGVINGYDVINFNQSDQILNTGILYKFKENVYANLQYTLWGVDFNSDVMNDYNFNRLFFVLSVKI